MALLHRIKLTNPNTLSHHFRRFYFNQIHAPSKGLIPADYCYNHVIRGDYASIYTRRPADLFRFIVRFYAAPVQFQRKAEEKEKEEPKGHRLNDQIKAEFIRLVSDEGHSVVPRRVALQRAKELKLDLVEVDRSAKPPVCRIMDYHKERYIRKVKLKERSKIKAQGTLKGGDVKEVRFSAKTEMKDLKMKADKARSLMERGYRVKCFCLCEDQEVSGLLGELLKMLEDVAFVELGPKVERKQAYFIVRHIKFGTSKKGAKKASNPDGATDAKTQKEDATSSAESEEETCSEDSNMDNDDEVESPLKWKEDSGKTIDQNKDVARTGSHADVQIKHDTRTATPAGNDKAPGFSVSQNPNFRAPNVESSRQETENRYANMQNRMQNRYGGRTPAPVGNDTENRYANMQNRYVGRTPAPVGNDKAAGFSQSGNPNFRAPNLGPSVQEAENRYARNVRNNAPTPNRRPEPHTNNFSAPDGHSERASGHGSQSQGFGIFSVPKTDATGKPGAGVEGNQSNRGNPSFVRANPGPAKPDALKSGGNQGSGANDTGKYGIFSRKS